MSDEFSDYRETLRKALTLPNVEVKIQEDFKGSGGDTLRTLGDYVGECETVVHFFGDMTGSKPAPSNVDDLLSRHPELEGRLAAKGLGREALKTLTYTQWEAWLAIGFDRDLVIVAPADGVVQSARYAPTAASRASQAEHLKRLRTINCYPEKPPFTSADNLVAQIFLSAVRKALIKAGAMPARQPRNLPFASLGDLFKGRDKALDDLRASLASAKGAAVTGRALHGLGGIGKTRLAIEYAWAHEKDYSALLFVRADDPATLEGNLAALAGPDVLDLPEKEAKEDAAKIAAVLGWLEAHPTWLLILDNVDDEKAVAAAKNLMPRLKGGHAIVTARAANFPGSLHTFELDALDEDAATQFLIERTVGDRETAKDDAAQARSLARELGGLALGLEQAGAHISTERIGFARYLRIWNENRDAVLAWGDETLTGSDKTLATTWTTSVARLSPESRRLLDRLAMLAPDAIPNTLFDVAVPGEAAGYDAYDARKGLYAYSLATQAKDEDGAAKGLVVHRLVQDFARRAMSGERQEAALHEALEWVNSACDGDPWDVRTWPVLDPLAPHMLALTRSAHEARIAAPTYRLLSCIGLLLTRKARYSEAEPVLRQALSTFEQSLGPDHPDVAAPLSNLALLLRETNRRDEAEPLIHRALAIDEAHFGLNHPNILIRLNNFATLLYETNRPAEAEPLFRRALSIAEVHYGPDHSNLATPLSNLAGVLGKTNRPAEAEPLLRRALSIVEASFGKDHPNLAMQLNNLATLLRQTGRLSEAEQLYRRALQIWEKSFGLGHPLVKLALNNLALLLQATNRTEEAEPLYRRALAIDEVSYGPDHPEVATDLNHLAGLLRETNRLAEAEPFFRRALSIFEKNLGPDHPKVATGLGNLAGLLHATNRLAEAEPLFRRALKIDEASYGPDHSDVAVDLNNLASLLYGANRLAEAEPLVRRALKIEEANLGPDNPEVAGHLNNLASLLQQTNRLAEAELLYRRALAIDDASLGPNHPKVARDLNNLASLLQARNRLADAEPLVRRALAISEKSLGPVHPNTVAVRKHLAAILVALGKEA